MTNERADQDESVDFVVIGSGFGGSVAALRLTEKGYRVLVLERGKRFRDEDFPRTNWNIWRYLWMPALRCFGMIKLTLFPGVVIVHGNGVGGGSLAYAGVLVEPDDSLFAAPGWRDLADWKAVLRPYYETARRMLGVAQNPRLWPADDALRAIAQDMGRAERFRPSEVGVYFGEAGVTVPDPYFEGEGPPRTGCTHCGACMVGCREGAKNTLVKNYLYLAEKRGAEVRAECAVRTITPLPEGQADGARYLIEYVRSTRWRPQTPRRVRARGVVVAAGVLGTLELLFRCREQTRTLPRLSACLGDAVRTNRETMLGSMARDARHDYSKGIAITSILQVDDITHIEPVRYPDGSSLVRLASGPLVEDRGDGAWMRFWRTLGEIVRHPLDFLQVKLFSPWARRNTILLIMQTEEEPLRIRWGRSFFTLFRGGLVEHEGRPTPPEIGYRVTRDFAQKTNGIPQASLIEDLFNIPTTAHILGGCMIGRDATHGVVDLNCEVFEYPGLYVVDGSIVPANPGVNPSLTITALAEYAMSKIAAKARA